MCLAPFNLIESLSRYLKTEFGLKFLALFLDLNLRWSKLTLSFMIHNATLLISRWIQCYSLKREIFLSFSEKKCEMKKITIVIYLCSLLIAIYHGIGLLASAYQSFRWRQYLFFMLDRLTTIDSNRHLWTNRHKDSVFFQNKKTESA